MPKIQPDDNGDSATRPFRIRHAADPADTITITIPLRHLLDLEDRIAALEARNVDVASIAANAYELGLRSTQPLTEKPDARHAEPDQLLRLRHACRGSGPPLDFAIVDPDGVRHTLRVTPGVTDPDDAWRRFHARYA